MSVQDGGVGLVRGSEARRLKGRRAFLLALGAALVIAAAWLGLTTRRLWVAALAVRSDLAALESLAGGGVEQLDVEQAVRLFRTTRADLQAVEAAARPFLWAAPYLGWLPRYGPDVAAAPALLQIALDLTGAGEEALEPLLPLLDGLTEEPGGDGRSMLPEVVAALEGARPQLDGALAALEQARTVRDGLPADRLSPLLQGLVARLDRYLPLLEQGLRAALLAPGVLGADEPRTFLVLVQNEDELRPTGGFISGVAQVTVEDGQVLDLQFEDSYAVDDFSHPYPEPPAPLREFMLIDLWVFRDSNWSPDFPTSARAAIELYTISRDVSLDGVVALDQETIRLLVEALGPLQVESSAEPVTGRNVIRLAREAWEPGEGAFAEWWEHRKDFMGAVLDAAVLRLEQGLDRSSLLRLARALVQALQQRHLQLYLADREGASLIAELGWDGALTRPAGDSLMVVDANLGFNKANAAVEESLDYTVDLRNLSRPRATLIVSHTHLMDSGERPCRQQPRYDATYEQMIERCYWDYLRVYVPSGSQLVGGTPHAVSGAELLSGRASPAEVWVGPEEAGHQVFATFLLLRPAERLETGLEYLLPESVIQVRDGGLVYTLLVHKQPGTRAIPLRVRVLLPAGAVLAASDPEPTAASGGAFEFSAVLDTSWTLEVRFASTP